METAEWNFVSSKHIESVPLYNAQTGSGAYPVPSSEVRGSLLASEQVTLTSK